MAHPPLLKKGDKFNRLTVDSWCKEKKRYKCICECGTEAFIASYHLKHGLSKSCGCLSRELTSKRNYKSDDTSAKNTLYLRYRDSAKTRGYEFNLSREDVANLISKNCYYCGQEPDMVLNETKRYVHAESDFKHNGIDRVDNSKGYDLDNCVPCCKICNLSKRTLGLDEWLAWIERVYKFQRRSS